MSDITIDNQPHLYMDAPEVVLARNGIVSRGEYLYFIAEAAKRRGIPLDFLYEAIYDWGKTVLGREWKVCPEPADLEKLFTEVANKVWENEITVTDDKISISMHHCPFLTGWMRHTDDRNTLRELCLIAMEADRGMFNIPGYEYELTETVLDGCEQCTMVARKIQSE